MAFLDENGLQEFVKLLVEKGEWLGADPDNDDYFDYIGEYGVRASYARYADRSDYAGEANRSYNADHFTYFRDIKLTGAVTGEKTWDGSEDLIIQTTANITPSSIGASQEGHTHTALINSQGGMVNLLYNTDSTYALAPQSAVDGTAYTVNLGRAETGKGFQHLYLNGNAVMNGGVTAMGNSDLGGTLAIGGITTASARIQPYASSQVNLGYSDKRWMNIYSNSNLNVSSDLKVKKDIVEIDDRYIELFDLVQPYAYKFIDGTSGRVHTGFISQHVEEAMEKVGLTAEELAFFCKDIETEPVYDEDGNFVEDKEKLDENGNPVYYYSLRYGEYVAIMTEKIKRMEKRIDELETKLEKVDAIEARLSVLETA